MMKVDLREYKIVFVSHYSDNGVRTTQIVFENEQGHRTAVFLNEEQTERLSY